MGDLTMQLIVSDAKTGQSYKIEIPKDRESEIIGKRIGDVIDGGFIGAGGYKLQLTGGSDGSGFPMRREVVGTKKTKVLLSKGVGFKTSEGGERKRKLIRGNTYSNEIVQVNSKIVEYGPIALDQLFKKEEKKEEKK
ncbi:MAG: 30S ribosomal protein S6e [Candidatus Bilamarchaeaceae archaeon]